jgi:hypothetical protein
LLVASLVALATAALVWLASGLRADAFFSGDSGLKLIAAHEAIAHPRRPFEIDLPRVDGRPAPLVDSMVSVHEGHGHVIQSPLFPILSAPAIALFGNRGAYLLPALGFLAILPLLEAVRRAAAAETSFAVLAWLTVVASPLLFYALEYWEHALAVAVVAAATAVAMLDRRVTGDRPAPAVGCGVLMGIAALLRPESLWYAAALGVTMARPRWIAYGSGLAAMLLPFAAANLTHFGDPFGPHASAVLAPLGTAFLAARWERIHAWLWPASLLEGVGMLLVAAAWLMGLASRPWRERQLVALAGVAIVAVLAADNALRGESFWQGFPIALLALVPAGPLAVPLRRLAFVAAATIAGIVLTATHDGGAQWGARYLLVAAPPLLLLAARAATEATGAGRWRAARMATVAVILIAGAMTSRQAYLDLRGAKRRAGAIVAATAALPPGETVLTNVWWFDQMTASLHGTRTVLVADSPGAATMALTALGRRGLPVTLVWTADAEGEPLDSAVHGTCYRITSVQEVPERELRFASARCVR